MKIAIISDIHSNINALNLVLKDMEKRGVNRIICLGDLVTKYFYPKEVVEEIKNVSDIVIKGNCDDLVSNNTNYKWARGQLGLDNIEYLDNLPVKEQTMFNKQLINLYHSNPKDLESMFNPLFNDNAHTRYKDMTIPTEEYNRMFEDDKPQTTIVGHTHMNYIGIEKKGKLKIVKSPTIITKIDRAILNAGSVGEHSNLEKDKNGNYEPMIDPYITYLLLDDSNLKEGFKAEIIKVPYKEELKKVFFDAVNGQIKGDFPYSPLFTERMGNGIKRHNDNDKSIDNIVDEKINDNIEAESKRKGR
jgi:protein phosphatase